MFQGFDGIQVQMFAALQAVAREDLAAVEVFGHLDGRLGWHAADPGTGGSQFSAIYRDHALAGGAHLAERIQAGAAQTDDGDIHLTFLLHV